MGQTTVDNAEINLRRLLVPGQGPFITSGKYATLRLLPIHEQVPPFLNIVIPTFHGEARPAGGGKCILLV